MKWIAYAVWLNLAPALCRCGPCLSGFRLLTHGEYAFDTRAALAEAAPRSIDAQYDPVYDDTAGVVVLRGLRDAARRGVRVRLLLDDYHGARPCIC